MATNNLFSFLGTDASTGGRRGRTRRSRTAAGGPRRESAKHDIRIHLLDVGTEQYGDCVLLQLGDRTVLVDGGHKGNIGAQGQAPSIPTQLEHLLVTRPPFKIDLLVTTHCHADHLGCLPELVSQNLLDVTWALAVDERLGFPHTFGDDARLVDGPAARLVAALFEEKRPDSMSDAALQQFLQDAAAMSERYTGMLDALKNAGSRIVRYGRDSPAALQRAFSNIGLEILGPSQEQLELCRDYLMKVGKDAADALASRDEVEDLAGETRLYRDIVRQWTSSDEAEDRVGPGAGKNNQSLVLKFDVDGIRLLLTGDMQFAKPEVAGLDEAMGALRRTLQAAGPYHFVKIAHHGSYNAFNEDVLADLHETKAFATQNGTHDATHPADTVLKLLHEHRDELEWARTDRNGLVTVTFPNGSARMEVTRGRLNDATLNSDAGEEPERTVATTGSAATLRPAPGGIAEFSASARVPAEVDEVTVTFTARSHADASRGTAPRDRTERGSRGALSVTGDVALAGGRSLPDLLFLTHSSALTENLGSEESRRVLDMIHASGQRLLDIRDTSAPFAEARRELSRGTYKGVVLVGGYDVLPAQRLDVLDGDLRRRVGANVANDADQFIVWSDATYGDVDGDGLPEIPVSRVPDGKSPRLITAALTATRPSSNPGRRFGVRNVARPFATGVFRLLNGNGTLLVSKPTSPKHVGNGGASGEARYFMLHGSDANGAQFYGEDGGSMFEAVNLSNLAPSAPGVVFTGCCWGALIVDTIASRAVEGRPPASRSATSSIALACLLGGALAYIGCTGSHYSPTDEPYDYFGGPMHQAFWRRYNEGRAPAEALFAAKVDYVGGMPHGQTRADGEAIEMKILRQYTCLGLGW